MRRVFFAAAVFVLAGCASTPAPASSPSPSVPPGPLASSPPLHQVHDPGRVTGTLSGPCRTRDAGRLPDPSCTPGAYDPRVTAAVLCAPGYRTGSYRPPAAVTDRFKWDVAEPAYGQRDVPGELDHLVPLELGGSNDASNLWPEAGKIPNAKDETERRLHDWVCAATGTQAQGRLQIARQAIAADWETALQVTGAGGAS